MADIITLSNRLADKLLMTPQLVESLKAEAIQIPIDDSSLFLDTSDDPNCMRQINGFHDDSDFQRHYSEESEDASEEYTKMMTSPFIHLKPQLELGLSPFNKPSRRRRSATGRSFGDLETIQEFEPVNIPPSRTNVHERHSRAAARWERRARSGELPVILRQMEADRLAQEAEEVQISRDDSTVNIVSNPSSGPQTERISVQVLFSQRSSKSKPRSLVMANRDCEKAKAGTFDTVAVSFWLAQLQFGTSLIKLKNNGDGEGKAKEFTLEIHKTGKVCIHWISSSLFGKVSKSAYLSGTKAVNLERMEFLLQLEGRKSSILVKAMDYEVFELWTQGMKYIFCYARVFGERSRKQSDRGKSALHKIFRVL